MTAISRPIEARVLADLLPGSLIRDVILVAGAAALTGLAAQIAIPLPFTPVPITLQTFTVLLAGAALGPLRGVASMLLYMVVGGLGVPWYANGASGFGGRWNASVERMKSAPQGAPINMMSEMQHATLDVIVETILGGADPNFGYDRIKTTVEDYMQVMGKPDMLDMVGAPPWVPRPWGGKGRRAASALRRSAVNAIDRRRASGETRNDLLGLLLAARDPETGRGFSDDELRDNVVTFIGAGHETTALTLTFALYLIANAPEVQDRLLREVLDVAGDKPIDAAMVDELKFHEQVIKESMRLYPPVAIIDRMAAEDIDLGDAKVKKGDFAFALIYVMHRHKMLWENPERFDPDRFSEERAKGMHRFQYIPFGAGPRICIGMKFAYMEAVAILATLVRALRFHPNPAHRVEPNIRITLRPEGGMPLHVESRVP